MFQRCNFTIMAQIGEWAWGSSARQETFLCLVQSASCVLDPPRCRSQVSVPGSTAREEALGVGGLCNLAKGVYTEIQAGETNGGKRKTFTHK